MANPNLRSSLSTERKPKLLKDFLNDESTNDFGLHPRKPCRHVVKNRQLIVFKRSKSSRAATSTILAIHKASEIVIKTLRYLPFASIKSPSILPRSISHKLSSRSRKKEEDDNQREITTMKVQVKDILRWRSSRDLLVEESTPSDIYYSPSRYTINTASSGSTSCSSPLTSKSSSWCDSDFSAEDFPSWCYAFEDCYGENEMKMPNKKRFSPQGSLENTIMDEADEQYTPVSVLASPFQEDKELHYPCRFAKIKSMSQIIKFRGQEKQVNETEEKAEKLLHHLKETTLPNNYNSFMRDNLLMDFFWEELTTGRKEENEEILESQLVETAQDWLSGAHEGCLTWMRENKRNNYLKEMEKGLKWNKHDEEKDEIALQLEKLVINSLLDDALFDIVTL